MDKIMRPGLVQFTDGRVQQGPTVRVEILETPEERQRGLMERVSLAEEEGALFWMPSRDDHLFWMRHTRVPLDLIFIDRDVVVGVLTLIPMDETRRSIGRPSTTVLEVNGGFAERHRIAVGQKVTISLV